MDRKKRLRAIQLSLSVLGLAIVIFTYVIDKKENGGIISSDEEDEMLRYRLKRLQGSKTNNFGEKSSDNQEGKSIAYDVEPSLQKIPSVSKDVIGSTLKDTDIQMGNNEKRKMEELDNNPKNEKC